MYEELVKQLRELQVITEHCDEQLCPKCVNKELCNKYDNKTMSGTYKEAANAIEELDTLLDGVSEDNDALCETIEKLKKPRWIPVTERLPEEDGEYLTWFRVDDSEPSFGIFPFDANVPAFGYWDDYYDPVTYGWAGSDFIEVKGVTHWMPLPTPPKEEIE